MNIQLVNISHPEVFKNYSKKYKIFRDLYEQGLSGIEIRDIPTATLESLQKIILSKNEICYKDVRENGEAGNLLVMGTIGTFKDLSREIVSYGNEDLGYKVSLLLRNYLEYDKINIELFNNHNQPSASVVMGILNVTPDSFSDGGRYFKTEDAVKHALEMIRDGADIIDIGGESTRPGSESVPLEEELNRIIPVIEQILKEAPGTVLSIDTTKKIVAYEALKRGAKIINDISGLSFEPDITDVVRQFNAWLVVMHIKGIPRDMQINPTYDEVVSEVYDFINQKMLFAKKAGVKNIIIDPGIGFGKRVEDNFDLIKRLDEFKGLGAPILVGVSRKAFLGKTTGEDVDNRDTASVITESLAIKNGAKIIRTHNVKNAVQAKKILKYFSTSQDILLNV
ncbi:MAG: dihydropteroate synthase [Ignavibacteriales bacterium]